MTVPPKESVFYIRMDGITELYYHPESTMLVVMYSIVPIAGKASSQEVAQLVRMCRFVFTGTMICSLLEANLIEAAFNRYGPSATAQEPH